MSRSQRLCLYFLKADLNCTIENNNKKTTDHAVPVDDYGYYSEGIWGSFKHDKMRSQTITTHTHTSEILTCNRYFLAIFDWKKYEKKIESLFIACFSG